MASWHPPIPAEAVYSDEAAQLGSGLRLLLYLYNGIQRNGTVAFSPKSASNALGVPYETARTWWQTLRPLGIVSVLEDHGKKGYLLQFDSEWIDWHVLAANYKDKPSVNGERANQPVEEPSNGVERSVNGSSIDFERANQPVEPPAYKVLQDDQNPPPPTTPQPAHEQAGGGGGEITETERLLLDFTPPFSASTAREFAHLNVDAVRAELKAAAAAGSGPGSLVARWRRVPPKAPVPKAAGPPVLQATKPNLPERAVSGATLLAMAESARRNRA